MEAGTVTASPGYSTERPPAAKGLSPGMALASRFEPAAYALMRAVTGVMFACHGLQKVLGWLGGSSAPIGSQLWIGGLIEIVAGTLVLVGLFTRAAAVLASGTMAVAYFQFHWKLAFGAGMWLPILNHGELAVLYCFAFLFIATRGGGIASLDARRRND